MTSGTSWTALTAQQLVRYEALFKLLDDIRALEDPLKLAQRIATQWKYFANVAAWRLVVQCEPGFLVIDGLRGEAQLTDVATLSPWDQFHWDSQRPALWRAGSAAGMPSPPDHLQARGISELQVLPVVRSGRPACVISVAGRHAPFSDLDNRFIHLFARHFADQVADILLRRQATEALLARATRDSLTGLLNRGTVIERLSAQLELARRSGLPLAVALVDVDHFKSINDHHGHLAGDAVLCQLAARLQARTRAADSVGRFGGEEFLVVLYPCSADEVVIASERLRGAVADLPFSIDDTPPKRLDVTISIGAALADARAPIDVQDLLRRADEALYRAKDAGRNRVTVDRRLTLAPAGTAREPESRESA